MSQDKWKAVLQDAAVNLWCLTEENKDDPKKLLAAIIDLEINFALDPTISTRAKALIDRGVAQANAEKEFLLYLHK